MLLLYKNINRRKGNEFLNAKEEWVVANRTRDGLDVTNIMYSSFVREDLLSC